MSPTQTASYRSRFWRLLAILALLLLSGCLATPEPEPTTVAVELPVDTLSVTGKLVPAVWTTASAVTGGHVTAVLVSEGEVVEEGDALVQLDDRELMIAVRQAETAVQRAQAELDLLKAGPRQEDLDVAAAQIEAARAAVTQTFEQRDQLWTGALDANLVSADAAIAAAEADELTARQIHDEMMRCTEVELPDGTKREVCPTLGTYEERARFQWHATLQQLAAARANKEIIKPEHWAQLAIADAAIGAAREQLALTEAQAEQIAVTARPAEVAVAEAGIAQAEAALDAAELALTHATVRAPLAGTVSAVDIRVGQIAAPGSPLITLGDLSTLQIETTDLDEIDVGRVMVEQRAVVTFDALPDRTFDATVTRISPIASPTGAGVNYTVVLVLDDLDPTLRWGMTAFVDLLVGN